MTSPRPNSGQNVDITVPADVPQTDQPDQADQEPALSTDDEAQRDSLVNPENS